MRKEFWEGTVPKGRSIYLFYYYLDLQSGCRFWKNENCEIVIRVTFFFLLRNNTVGIREISRLSGCLFFRISFCKADTCFLKFSKNVKTASAKYFIERTNVSPDK